MERIVFILHSLAVQAHKLAFLSEYRCKLVHYPAFHTTVIVLCGLAYACKLELVYAQVEKMVGKKDFQDAVGEFVIKKPGKPALVKESDKREAITNRVTAAEAFKEEK